VIILQEGLAQVADRSENRDTTLAGEELHEEMNRHGGVHEDGKDGAGHVTDRERYSGDNRETFVASRPSDAQVGESARVIRAQSHPSGTPENGNVGQPGRAKALNEGRDR
jgi:hypothetical protein